MKKSDDSKKKKEDIEEILKDEVKDSKEIKDTEEVKEDEEKEFKNLRIELEDEDLKDGESREKIISEEEIMDKFGKMGFFKRLVMSIKDFDKYIEIAMLKVSNSIGYIFKLLLICAVIIGVSATYVNVREIKANPEKIISQVEVVKKTYNLEADIGLVNKFITENTDTQLFLYIVFPMIIALYLAILVSTFLNIFIIAILGYGISRIMKIPLKFRAVFNMAASALTLSIVINLVYTLVNQFTGFTINYFDFMYDLIAYVYMFVSIMFIRTEIIKRHMEGEEAK